MPIVYVPPEQHECKPPLLLSNESTRPLYPDGTLWRCPGQPDGTRCDKLYKVRGFQWVKCGWFETWCNRHRRDDVVPFRENLDSSDATEVMSVPAPPDAYPL